MRRILRPALVGLALAGAAGSAATVGLPSSLPATTLSSAVSAPAPPALRRPAAPTSALAAGPGSRGPGRRPGATGPARRAGLRRPLTRRALVAVGPVEHGVASWYTGGGRTADGELFDPGGLTAASPDLPFGTLLQVCTAGRCVQVRVNDRGPYVAGRMLDLTEAAAARLGYLSAGVAEVSATPVAQRSVTVLVAAASTTPTVIPRVAPDPLLVRATLRGTRLTGPLARSRPLVPAGPAALAGPVRPRGAALARSGARAGGVAAGLGVAVVGVPLAAPWVRRRRRRRGMARWRHHPQTVM